MNFCPNCGTRVIPGSHFCERCGVRLAAYSQTPPQQQMPNGQPPSGNIQIISGGEPVFRMKCEVCCCVFEYRRQHLGYRAWYPNGFVYCPKCQKPLRHHAEYQVR